MLDKRIAVIDFETDPFKFGRLPIPFAWGFYDGKRYASFWQSDAPTSPKACAKKLADFLESLDKPYTILAHNGGKFDFLYLIEYLHGKVRIVNGRILEASIGKHILRDSYAILPVPLKSAGDKLDIDYKLMEADVREKHKDEIMHYLRQDCIALYDLVQAFYDEFGFQLTIGGTAMKELQKFHSFERSSESFDKHFRPYYFGGRCQCFKTGIINAPIKTYDVNSSYPDTMKNKMHPVSVEHDRGVTISKWTCFVRWQGENDNAVPTRKKEGLFFNVPYGEFFSTIHEFNAGLETDTIKPHKILETIQFQQISTFEDFIDHFYAKRLVSDAQHDIFHKLFYKLILNSGYGKFAQDPDSFEDCIILPIGEIAPEPYHIAHAANGYAIWARPSLQRTYFNVATAASITGGARATLLRGIANAYRPLYCDTDSIFCESMAGSHDSRLLGSWKQDGEGDMIAIAGKKLYALFDGDTCVKKASKGTRLDPLAICMIARGDKCESRNDAPTFKLDGNHVFISRLISATH